MEMDDGRPFAHPRTVRENAAAKSPSDGLDSLKVIQFIIGAVAMEYSLVAACYMDSEDTAGNMAAIKFVAGAVIAAAGIGMSRGRESNNTVGKSETAVQAQKVDDVKAIPEEHSETEQDRKKALEDMKWKKEFRRFWNRSKHVKRR